MMSMKKNWLGWTWKVPIWVYKGYWFLLKWYYLTKKIFMGIINLNIKPKCSLLGIGHHWNQHVGYLIPKFAFELITRWFSISNQHWYVLKYALCTFINKIGPNWCHFLENWMIPMLPIYFHWSTMQLDIPKLPFQRVSYHIPILCVKKNVVWACRLFVE
jgi:hypothetical protein